MTEPTRWADDDTELTADERRVLAAGLRPSEVPRDAEDALWGALSAKLPLTTASATLGAASATKAAATLSLLKMGLTGVLLGSVVTVAWVGGEHLASRPPSNGPPVSSAAAPAPPPPRVAPSATSVVPVPALDPVPDLPVRPVDRERPNASGEPPMPRPVVRAPEAAAAERSVASFPVPPPPAASAGGSPLLESRRVADARARLRAGDARGALATLEGLRRDFPGGVLAQERDALMIEALLALGERERARQLATRFVARYPGSPHTAAAERALK